MSLEEDYKEIFLDVACIMKGWQKDVAIKALESCGLHARNGLRVLQQKSLITFYKNFNYDHLGMHDHIVEMGRNIVRRGHPDEPHSHSRLWKIDEIEEILANDLGTKATRCIQFHTKKINSHIFIKGLRKMTGLRFLYVSGDCSSNLELSIVGPDFPNALRYLDWTGYPFRSLPTTFQTNNHVALEMDGGRIVQLWEGGERKVLNKLRFLDLSCSKLSTFDFGLTPNLETLTLRHCYDLLEVHMTVGCLKLTSVNLGGSSLRSLDLGQAPSLEELDLVECKYLEKIHLPRRSLNLRRLLLANSKLRNLDIGLTPNLEKLDLKKSYCLEELHMENQCQKLTELKISHSNLRTLDLGMTPNLKKLDLKECRKLVELHTPIGCLKELVHVDLSGCLRFSSFLFDIEDYTSCSVDEPLEIGPLAELHLFVESLERCKLHPDNNLPTLQFDCVYIDNRPSLTRNLEMLFSVGMCVCTNLETFSLSIYGLRRLRKLKLKGSFLEAIKDLDQLESLEKLILFSTNIKHLLDSICMLKRLKYLKLYDCFLLEKLPEDLGQLECLEKLYLIDVQIIKHLPDSIRMLKHLKYLKLYDCLLLEKLPEDLGQLECLEKLYLIDAKIIKHLPDSICMLKRLKYLKLHDCLVLEKLPEDLGQIECLEDLYLSCTKIKYLPDSICKLKRLKYLKLHDCLLLEKLPEDLGQLECLEELHLEKSELLQDIPNSICEMKCLKFFYLFYCIRVEKLPDELGRLECLGLLHIEGTSISHLPQSILLLKGLRIIGSRQFLELCGFTSEIQTLSSYCYVRLPIKQEPTAGVSSTVLQG